MGYPPRLRERLMGRHAAAWEQLRDGGDPETVRVRFGYPSLAALRQGANRYRRSIRKGPAREYNAGSVIIQGSRPNDGFRLVLSRCPLDRAGWSPGDPISWHVHEDAVLLFREEAIDVDPAPDDLDAQAYRLVRIERLEISDAATRLGTSRSTLHRMVQRYARSHPWLRVTLHPRGGTHVSGVVRVTARAGQPTLILTTPVAQQKWTAGEIVEWRYYPDSRGLRLTRIQPTQRDPDRPDQTA